MKLSIYEEVHELRKELIEIRKMQNTYQEIFDALMKMIDYTNQKLLINSNQENENEERVETNQEEYNKELTHVFDLLRKMKKLEI